MIVHILYFVKDRVYVSMTCSKLKQTLLKMIDTKQITDYNDPYVLSQKYKIIPCIFDDNLKQTMPHITNHKSLDYICYVLSRNEYRYSWDNSIFVLLKRCCITNYASHAQYIINIFGQLECLQFKPSWDYVTLLSTAFTHKSWNIILILMNINDVKDVWIHSMIFRYKYEKNIDVIIDEINFLVDNGIIDYEYAFNKIWLFYDSQLILKHELLKYLRPNKDTQFKIEI